MTDEQINAMLDKVAQEVGRLLAGLVGRDRGQLAGYALQAIVMLEDGKNVVPLGVSSGINEAARVQAVSPETARDAFAGDLIAFDFPKDN